MHLICQQCPLRRQVSYGWTRSIFFCFDFGVHVPILQLAGDVNLLPVRLSRAEFFFSSSSNFHHGSNAAALHCPPPPPPPRFQTLICRKVFICTLERTFKWWMGNVKHCTHLLFLPFSKDVDWHHEDLSLRLPYLPSPPPPLLRMYARRPESLEFSLRQLHSPIV